MVVPGTGSNENASHDEIAEKTIYVLKKCVPNEVPGIAFLSGGQTEIESTVNLNSINQSQDLPWEITFSYGRALQQSALNKWQGKQENIAESQKIFLHRAKMNSLAHNGNYKLDLENN